MPWFFESAELFTPLCPLYNHDGTTPAGVLTTRLSKTWPLPITSSSVLETLDFDVAVLVRCHYS
jgi:hypothetical protein